MRHVLVFSLVYCPHFIGGAEVAVKEITDRLDPAEISFDMVTLNAGGEAPEETIGNIRVHRVFGGVNPVTKLFFPFAAYFKALNLNRRRPYDATWSIMANRAGFAALFFKWSHPEIPFVLTLQEGDPTDYPRRRAWFVYPLFKYIFRKADRITAISNYLSGWARSMGAKCPIEVVPNGVDLGLYAQASPLRPTVSTIITTSRLVGKNAVGDIVRALKLLPESFRLVIAGKGPLESELKVLAGELGISDRVSFLGHVEHRDLPGLLASADVFVRPSLSEGLGISFLEAMAAGLPVIATPVGGIVDFLKDGETGLFCEVGKPESIAKQIDRLSDDPALRQGLIIRARNMIAERYGWDRIARDMKRVLTA